ncbi:MAG: AraC family transcriptional regulator [Lachnospiraceae bacterium]|nr:AraC family transcriptional regulator [Lachnospiraceae bacterium]
MIQPFGQKKSDGSFPTIDLSDEKISIYALKYQSSSDSDLIINAENELLCYVNFGNIQKAGGMLKDRDTLELLFSSHIRKSLFRTSLRAVWLLTKACIFSTQKAMENESMRPLLESFINEAENCRSVPGLLALFERYIVNLTSLMRGIANYSKAEYSPLVRNSIDMILDSMPEKLSLDELAASLHVTPKYLSTLFNRDTGISITDFMQNIRIDAAKYMLAHSDMNYPDISNYLCFGSQSYFNQVFKKKTGVTPRKYRMQERNTNENSYYNQ